MFSVEAIFDALETSAFEEFYHGIFTEWLRDPESHDLTDVKEKLKEILWDA